MSAASEEAVGIQEIADILKVSKDTAYRLARTGELPGFRVGLQWRFYPDVVRAHFATPSDPWAQTPRSLNARRAS